MEKSVPQFRLILTASNLLKLVEPLKLGSRKKIHCGVKKSERFGNVRLTYIMCSYIKGAFFSSKIYY